MKINQILQLSDINPLPSLARHAKLVEESGEFAEAILYKLNILNYKTMKEPVEGEAADVIICVIDTLKSLYPDMDHDEFNNMLQSQIDKKCNKWSNLFK
jgi:NTP pyrophosphatase (non-canonical NTP hydrolase)